MPTDPLTALLASGCKTLGVDANAAQQAALCRYTELTLAWGKRMNLTGAKDAQQFTTHHLLDALAALPHLSIQDGQRWVDVGAGNGVPGIPLAILTPKVQWTLVEPREKRWAFLLKVVHTLGLNNVALQRARIENANIDPASQDGVTSRALGTVTLSCHPWLRSGGQIALYVGADTERWDDATDGLPLHALPAVALQVPGLGNRSRQLICLTKD